jgi:PAS domain S-box-containing protein
MPPIRTISKLTIFFLLNLSICLMMMPGHACAAKKQVLILHSYDHGGPWTDNVMQGMLSILDHSGMDLEIHVEYMDTKRHLPEDSFSYLENFYRQKYGQTAFDAILLSDNNALTFILSRRHKLFPDVPVVFCGINNFNKDLLGDQTGITGITEDIDIKGTIALACRILPSIQKFIVINDRTPTGRANLEKFEHAVSNLPAAKVSFELWNDITASDLQERLTGLSPDSAVLVFTFHRDKNGQWFSIPEYWTLIRESCRSPIFSFWDNDLGHGVLGGVMVYGEEQGKRCAEYAIRILKGESAASLPILFNSPDVPLLDYRLLRKFKIPKENIPANAVILFETESLFSKYRNEIITTGILLAALIVLVIVFSVNIMIRHGTELALKQSEERYRLLVENQKDMVVKFSRDQKMLFVSPSYCKTFGIKEENILGRSFFPLIHEDDIETVKTSIASLEKPPHTTYHEERAKTAEGWRWIGWSLKAIVDDSGNIVEIFSVGRDITDQKRAEEALLEAYSIINRSPVVVFLWKNAEQWPVEFASDNVKELFGYTVDEFSSGKISYAGTVYPDDLERVVEEVSTFSREKERKEFYHEPYRIITKNGEVKWLDDRTYIRRGENGNITHYEGIVMDITDRMRIEQDKKKLETQLQQAQKLESMGILAGGIAHDFNNILTTILGNVTLAKCQVTPEDELFDLLSEAETASARAQTLTRQLLTFAKGGAPVKETASIKEILKESFSFVLRGSKSCCEFSIAENLWPADADVGQISQVINNIVINANQAMPKGGIIQVAAENLIIEDNHGLPGKPGRYIRISVTDQGVGIAQKHLLNIFDPYFTTKQEGSGLGLATAYSIIKRHDGHIVVESRLEVGTTFHIYLPASEKAVPEKEEIKLIKGHGRILVMDDEASLRKIVGRMLGVLGYEAEFARDGAEAIRMVKEAKESEKPYDAVILDLTVPGGMGGKEAINKLLEIDPEVKAIVSSGYSDDPVLANFQEYGFKAMMPKPFEFLSLGKVLHDVLQVKKND